MKVFFYFCSKKKSHMPKHMGPIFKTILIASKSYFTSINSTSKIKVAFGGITPPAPAAP